MPGDDLVPFDEADDPDELFDLDDDLTDVGGLGVLGGVLGGLRGAAPQPTARAATAARRIAEGSAAGGALRVRRGAAPNAPARPSAAKTDGDPAPFWGNLIAFDNRWRSIWVGRWASVSMCSGVPG